MLGWMTHKLESRLLGEIATTRYEDDTTLMAEGKEYLKSLDGGEKRECEKSDLKVNIQKLRSQHPVQSLHGK